MQVVGCVLEEVQVIGGLDRKGEWARSFVGTCDEVGVKVRK